MYIFKMSNKSIKTIISGWVLIAFHSIRVLAGPVIEAEEKLGDFNFWVNRDFDWFGEHIPLMDSPDRELDRTYYYRWELVTRHLVYAAPGTGYVFTEFANRPFWSGAYGTISCPAGMQIDDVRWLANPRYVRDYMRFWMRHPGAQPRNYSFWAAESAWSIHEVQPHKDFITDLLPDLIKNYEAWENRGWVKEKGLFWQLGHDDGMEFDINAQQTNDILRGGQSLRPSFNSYMWADARALEQIAALAGDEKSAARFHEKASGIKNQIQELLWDPSRSFFFPMSNQRHEKDGHVIEKYSLTYQTGKFAGSIHGRELHGFVPWAFNLPDPGFEDAWKFLMDENFFMAPFGPTTVERNDPLFALKDGCCWWSGQSWPFATAQTLKGMANLIQNYDQSHVDREDYVRLLHTFSISHRKDGRPYVAEALNPFTGSWKGHDMPDRSEHYFHSGFTDLVITGLAGLQPSTSDTVVIKPLIPPSWDYFAMDEIPYHGHKLAVIWDRDGLHYGKGDGLRLLIDGITVAQSATVTTLQAQLPGGTRPIPIETDPLVNFAVNNDGDYYPSYQVSFAGDKGAVAMVHDGEYVYDRRPLDRWTTVGSPNSEDWIAVDFGTIRPIQTVELYIVDDGDRASVRAPQAIRLDYWNGSAWEQVPGVLTTPDKPTGGRPYRLIFSPIPTSRMRATLTHSPGKASALTEFMAWGELSGDYVPPRPPEGNIAYNPDPASGYPRIRASFHDQYGGIPEKAIDGRIIFPSNPVNRWTSYGSPDAVSDWLEIDFGSPEKVGRVVLHIFDDRGGVRAPAKISLTAWVDDEWYSISGINANPAKPAGGMANTLQFEQISTSKLRVVFEHIGLPNVRSGVTELEVWAE